MLAPILNKIKNGTDSNANGGSSSGGGGSNNGGNGSDTEKKSNATDSTGHISVQIEPAKKVKVSSTVWLLKLQVYVWLSLFCVSVDLYKRPTKAKFITVEMQKRSCFL